MIDLIFIKDMFLLPSYCFTFFLYRHILCYFSTRFSMTSEPFFVYKNHPWLNLILRIEIIGLIFVYRVKMTDEKMF